MNRTLLASLFILVAVIAGYLYNERIKPQAPPPVPLVQEAPPEAKPEAQAEAKPQPQASKEAAKPAAFPAALPVKDGRLLTRLANGLTVLIQEDRRFPLVSERLYVRAGSSYEAPGQEGISHLLEHMVFNSTAKRPKGGVAKDIEGVGGDINAATSFDYTVYLADLPAAHWALGLEVFKDMTFGAKFDPEELANEKQVVISELEKGQDESGQSLFQLNQGQVWEGKPYKHPVIGFKNTLQAITSNDLKAYVSIFYQPQSMLLVVVGDVAAADALEEITRLYGPLANDRDVFPADMDETPPGAAGPKAKARGGNWSKCYLHLSFATPGLHSAKDAPLEVLANLLGGGRTSKLVRKFHYDLQLVDDIDVGSITLERGGMLTIDATLSPDKLEAFWPELVKELAGLNEQSFTDEELGRAKLNIEDSMFRAKETLKGLATKLGYYQFFGFGPDGEANAVYAVRSVDRAQLGELVRTYITPGNANLAMLLPGQDKNSDKAQQTAQALGASLKAAWPASQQAAAGQGGGARAGEAEVVSLGGGRTVVLLPDATLPYASLSLTFKGGDALLTPDQQGLAELAAKSLTRSTAERGATQVEDFLADRAAGIGATSGRDTFGLQARYPARFAGDVLGLFEEIVTRPAFADEEFERAVKIQLAQIEDTLDKATSLAFRNLFPFLLPGSHYGYYRLGQPDRLGAFTPGDAKAFWEKQRHMPFVLAVCGVYDRKAVLALAASLAQGQALAAPPYETPAWGKERAKTMTMAQRNQTHLFWVFPTPGGDHPDTPALELAKAALAGQGGVLFQELRDKQGLGYSVTAFLWQAPKTGFLAFYIGTYPDKAQQAREGFENVVAELAAKGLSRQEADRAKSQMEGEYYIDHQSLASRSQEASGNLAQGYPLNRDKEVLAKAKALSEADVARVLATYLDPKKAYWFEIAP